MSYVPAALWEPRTKLSSDRKVALARERDRAKHPPALRNEIGLPLGSIICSVYACIVVGATASEIAKYLTVKFNRPVSRGNVLKYISDLRNKHRQNISCAGWGESQTYKLEVP